MYDDDLALNSQEIIADLAKISRVLSYNVGFEGIVRVHTVRDLHWPSFVNVPMNWCNDAKSSRSTRVLFIEW